MSVDVASVAGCPISATTSLNRVGGLQAQEVSWEEMVSRPRAHRIQRSDSFSGGDRLGYMETIQDLVLHSGYNMEEVPAFTSDGCVIIMQRLARRSKSLSICSTPFCYHKQYHRIFHQSEKTLSICWFIQLRAHLLQLQFVKLSNHSFPQRWPVKCDPLGDWGMGCLGISSR